MKTGIDLVDNNKIKKIKNITRLFSKNEVAYCGKFGKNSIEHFSGFYAVKEALLKALGCGIFSLNNFLEIEVLHNENGKPIVTLSGDVKKVFDEQGNKNIDVSISHTSDYSCAVCIIY